MDLHSRQIRKERLLEYAATFQKCWIEIDFKAGQLVGMRAVDLRDSFDNSTCLGPLVWPRDASRGFESPEFLQDTRRWWFNGHLLCNTTAPWSDRSMQRILEMFGFLNLPGVLDGTIILNRRDFPWLRHDFQVPFPWRYRARDAFLDRRFFGVPIQRPLSFYGGEDWQDLLIPIPEHWNVWDETEACRAIGGLGMRRPRLCFRGTLTGEYLDRRNPRISAICDLEQFEWSDCAFTDGTRRERVAAQGRELEIVRSSVLLGRRGDLLSMSQQSKNQVLLYIDGHVAASRKAWQLCCGSLLLCISSSCEAPRQWMDRNFHPARWSKAERSFDPKRGLTTHFECDVEDLADAAHWLLMRAGALQFVVDCALEISKGVFSKEHQKTVLQHAIMQSLGAEDSS